MNLNKEEQLINIVENMDITIPFEKSKINGIDLWHLSRRKIYYYLRSCNNEDTGNNLKKRNNSDYCNFNCILYFINKEARYIFYCFFSEIYRFIKMKKCNILILKNSRKIIYKNEFIDTPTYTLENSLISNREDYICIHQTKDRLLPLNKAFHVLSDANFTSDYFIPLYLRFFFPKKKLLELSEEISKKLSYKLKYFSQKKIYTILVDSYIRYFSETYKYRQIFSKIKPKKVYLTCGYSNEGLIKEAKKVHSYVIEMQHGFITRSHMGYNVPESIDIDFLPNEIKLFGKFWLNCKFHNSIVLSTHNYQWLKINDLYSDSFTSVVRNRKKYLFVSQPSIPSFSYALLQLAINNRDVDFLYKPHPRELSQNNYIKLIDKLKLISNVKISFSKRIGKVINSVDYVICCRSFVAYEALTLNKNVMLCSPFEDSPIPELESRTVFVNLNELPNISLGKVIWPTNISSSESLYFDS